MKITFRKLAWGLGMALAFGVLAATASAECGTLARPRPGASLQPQAGQDQFQAGRLLLVNQSADPIVGMWHVKFTAWGNGADGPPDGTPIDNAIVQWHSDGTEIMNSGRPPQDGNFCLGVWEKVRGHYKINHFALGNDPNGNPAGPTHIRQDVVLSRNGNAYAGTFSLDAFDPSGNQVMHIIGVISATRITPSTPVESLF